MIHRKFMGLPSGLCISIPVSLVNVSLSLRQGVHYSVSVKYQEIIKQWIDKISSFKTDTQVLVNDQGKYFMVSLLATGWLWSWRHALSEPWHFHIDIGRIQVCEHSENPPKLSHLNWNYLMNRNLISSTVHGYFIVAKGHKTSYLNRLQDIWYLMGKLSQVCSQSPVITYVKTTNV